MRRKLLITLALLGLLSIVFVAGMYSRGNDVLQQLDPQAVQVFGEFARNALEKGVASANVIKLPVGEDVSLEDAAEAMRLRANERNIKFINRLSFHKEVEAIRGEPYPYLEIFQFCDARTAADLLDYNRDFAAYMPCSITLFEDEAGKAWLVTMNLDMLIYGGQALAPELKQKVLTVKEGLLDIMAAGAAGDL